MLKPNKYICLAFENDETHPQVPFTPPKISQNTTEEEHMVQALWYRKCYLTDECRRKASVQRKVGTKYLVSQSRSKKVKKIIIY